ncbi:MAG TPA: hypothetical protein VGW39_02410 [Chthoniobacterales bacterium]|nr:hypothetical protein [Chthoniobacterales bacterium]
MKTDLDSLPPVTRVSILSHPLERGDLFPPYLDVGKIPALVTFIDGQRDDWTRTYVVSFGPPSPVYYANLFDGDTYLGYFAVGAGVLPDSSALFEVRYGKIYARKRVTRSEANRFLDLIGMAGELSEKDHNEVRQQVARQRSTPRVEGVKERLVKFRPGDRVRVKGSPAEGTVCLRTSFFRENLYYVTFPESYHVFDTIGERAESAAWHAANVASHQEWARSHGYTVVDYPEYQPRPWHEEGPFYESDLELAP